MIYDIYEQKDLLRIARCRSQEQLQFWLHTNKIPFIRDVQQRILAHSKAVEAAMGVTTQVPKEKPVKLNLETIK
jgi:hypothetical protein